MLSLPSAHCPLPIAPIAQCSGLVGHLEAEQIGRPSLPLFSRAGPISGNQHLLTNFFSYKMHGKDNNAMQRVFQVHILRGEKRRHFLKIGRRMKCHWFPPLGRILPHEVLASGRMNTNVNSTIAPVTSFSTLPLPGHSVLNECAQKQLDLSAERVAGVNTNSHAEVVSAGLQ